MYFFFFRIVTQLNQRFSNNEQIFGIFNIFDHANADFLQAECAIVHKFVDHYKDFL